jgi:hypothetical protein
VSRLSAHLVLERWRHGSMQQCRLTSRIFTNRRFDHLVASGRCADYMVMHDLGEFCDSLGEIRILG